MRRATIRVAEDRPVTITVASSPRTGPSISRIASDTYEAYRGQALPTSSFTVALEGPGTCTARVDAVQHSASYSISWEVSEPAGG